MYVLQEAKSVMGGLQNDLQLLSRRIGIAVDDGTSSRSFNLSGSTRNISRADEQKTKTRQS